MINLQAVLLRLAEPFMDAQFTKLDRIDGDFLGRSQRMDLSDETRVNATSEEVTNYSETLRSSSGV
jgi:ubiquitin conjugation factor E4 B